MGNSTTPRNAAVIENFQMQKYLNQGLSQNQILQIKEAFDSYEPVNDYIDIEKMKEVTEHSYIKERIAKSIGSKSRLNFDEFFQISKDLVQ
jgi:hypothetical protein